MVGEGPIDRRGGQRTPAAVVIGNHTQGLGIVRSAGVAGWPAWVVNDKALGLSRFSRYLSGYRQLRRGTLSSLDNPVCAEHLFTELLGLPVEASSLLLGVNEDITRFVFQYRPRLAAKYSVPDAALDRIYDKYLFNNLVPEAARIETRLYDDGNLDNCRPVEQFLVKGRQGNAFRRIAGAKAIPLARFLTMNVDRILQDVSPEQLIVQRIVTSDHPVVSVCSFSVQGHVQAFFQYEKLRQHPDRFGTGTYLRSVSVSGIQTIAAEVLGNLAFTGISEIEFIHDSASGQYKVVEMNPRTWKSTHFATQCGVNLVDAHLAYIRSGQRKSPQGYAVDRYWADLATDIPQMIRDKRLGRYHRGFHESSWESRDPLPGLALWTLFPLIALDRFWRATFAPATAPRRIGKDAE